MLLGSSSESKAMQIPYGTWAVLHGALVKTVAWGFSGCQGLKQK